ncbi:hypothetical protein MKX03_017927 [Papaver bracteatum]|nr:hypothetical protein MKX03_017927 [Papaver bracteatum]
MSDALINGLVLVVGGIIAQFISYPLQTDVHYYFSQVFRNKAEAAATARFITSLCNAESINFCSFRCLNVLLTNHIWAVVTHISWKRGLSPRILVQELFDEAGVLGFWKGVFPTLMKVTNPSIQFMIYETLLKKFESKTCVHMESNQWPNCFGGQLCCNTITMFIEFCIITCPLLVVKTTFRSMAGTLDAITKMIQYEGLYCFYTGMSTKITQCVLAVAVPFMVKEELV